MEPNIDPQEQLKEDALVLANWINAVPLEVNNALQRVLAYNPIEELTQEASASEVETSTESLDSAAGSDTHETVSSEL